MMLEVEKSFNIIGLTETQLCNIRFALIDRKQEYLIKNPLISKECDEILKALDRGN